MSRPALFRFGRRLVIGWFAAALLGCAGRAAAVALEAGQVYMLRADRTTGPGYRMFFWVEEAGSGRVVAGKAKP